MRSEADQKPTGIIPPLTTPFTEDGRVYEKGLRQLLAFLVDRGVHGLFICGTYGSGPIMTLEERKQVHQITVQEVGNRVKVIAHVGTASTEQSVELARHAEETGAKCVAAISPYYHRHDERSVLRHFEAIVGAVSLPVYIYNNPGACGFNVTANFLNRLADIGVVGIKDSGFSYIEFTHLLIGMESRPDFHFVVGTEGIALPAWMSGARGCVSGLSNAFPEIMVKLWDLFEKGDYEEAAKLQLQVNKARQILHIPSSTNAAIYCALHARNIDAGHPKAPILSVEKEKGDRMLAGFREIGLL
jgi:dihydrodipicolinate synthase/N-acetylneuraminate lyase